MVVVPNSVRHYNHKYVWPQLLRHGVRGLSLRPTVGREKDVGVPRAGVPEKAVWCEIFNIFSNFWFEEVLEVEIPDVSGRGINVC